MKRNGDFSPINKESRISRCNSLSIAKGRIVCQPSSSPIQKKYPSIELIELEDTNLIISFTPRPPSASSSHQIKRPILHKKRSNIEFQENNDDDMLNTSNSIDTLFSSCLNLKISYRIEKYSKLTLRGKRTHYQLIQGSTPIYHTKIKSTKNIDQILFSEGKQLHYNDRAFAGAILVSNDCTSFSLHDGSKYGSEILTIKYSLKFENQIWCSLCFDQPSTVFGRFLCTRKKEKLDFGTRLVKQSWKNMILEDSNRNEVVAVMKITKNAFFIDAPKFINDKIIFAIGVSAFLIHRH